MLNRMTLIALFGLLTLLSQGAAFGEPLKVASGATHVQLADTFLAAGIIVVPSKPAREKSITPRRRPPISISPIFIRRSMPIWSISRRKSGGRPSSIYISIWRTVIRKTSSILLGIGPHGQGDDPGERAAAVRCQRRHGQSAEQSRVGSTLDGASTVAGDESEDLVAGYSNVLVTIGASRCTQGPVGVDIRSLGGFFLSVRL